MALGVGVGEYPVEPQDDVAAVKREAISVLDARGISSCVCSKDK